MIDQFHLRDRIIITGYKYKDDYDKYLESADAAIQLRQGSRGETSRAVLDCMAYGLPTIINAHGSLNDYRDEDVIKLPEIPDLHDIETAMTRVLLDADFRTDKGSRARKTIVEQYQPEKIALAYSEVIERAIYNDERKLFKPFTDALSATNPQSSDLRSAAKLAASNDELRCQPCILVLVEKLPVPQGMTQVVRDFYFCNDPSVQFDVVAIRENRLVRAGDAIKKIFDLSDGLPVLGDELINVQPGDILLIAPAVMEISERLVAVMTSVKLQGGKCVALCEPMASKDEGAILAACDALVCRTQEDAAQLRLSLIEHGDQPANDAIYYAEGDESHALPVDENCAGPFALWLLGPIQEGRGLRKFEPPTISS